MLSAEKSRKRFPGSIWTSVQIFTDFLTRYRKDSKNKTALLCPNQEFVNLTNKLRNNQKKPVNCRSDVLPFYKRRFSLITNADCRSTSFPVTNTSNEFALNTMISRRPDERGFIQYVLSTSNRDILVPVASSVGSISNMNYQYLDVKPLNEGRYAGMDSGGLSTSTSLTNSESGMSSSNDPNMFQTFNLNRFTIQDFLSSCQLNEYIDVFIEHGIDMNLVHTLTPQHMIAIGITNPIHRRILRNAILGLNRGSFFQSLPHTRRIRQLLDHVNLSLYHDTLVEQGYRSVNDLLTISEEDMDDIGITKLGHQVIFTSLLKQLRRRGCPVLKNQRRLNLQSWNSEFQPTIDSSINNIDIIIDSIKRDLDAMIAYNNGNGV
ncbi:hypothetical protein ACOME3_009600 [Neoechinorhynchus agilis]